MIIDISLEHQVYVFIVATVLAVLLGTFVVNIMTSHAKHKRSWSFTSRSMIHGVFPNKVNAPDTIINGVMYFDKLPTEQDLAAQVVTPMLEYERLSAVTGTAVALDPLDLIRKVKTSGDDTETNRIIQEQWQMQLVNDVGQPWWEFLLVENDGDGQSAIVLRLHHSLADGISLVHMFSQILSHEDGSRIEFGSQRSSSSQRPRRNALSMAWATIVDFFRVITLGMTRYDDDIAFSSTNHSKMVYSGNRQAVFFPNVPLDFCKELKNAASGTINDVLMVAFAQAVQDYSNSVEGFKPVTTKTQCRALLPIALPRKMDSKSTALRNRWCMVSMDLGVKCETLADRLHHVHSETTKLKSSPRAYIQMWIQNALLPLSPQFVSKQIAFDIFSRHSVVFSNVPGPTKPCLVAGQVVKGVQMLFPNLIPQTGFLSYAGTIYGNLVLDTEALPHTDRIPKYFAKALVDMANEFEIDVPASIMEAANKEC